MKKTLEIAWVSNEHIDNPVKVLLEFSTREIERIKEAQQTVEDNGYNSIRIEVNATLLAEGDKESTFYPDVEYIIVYADECVYYAQHEADSSIQMESEAFNL